MHVMMIIRIIHRDDNNEHNIKNLTTSPGRVRWQKSCPRQRCVGDRDVSEEESCPRPLFHTKPLFSGMGASEVLPSPPPSNSQASAP